MSDLVQNDRRSRIGPLGCLAVLVVLLVLTPVVTVWIFQSYSAARVEEALARIRAEGEPADLAELGEYYALPAGAANSATLWMSATAPLSGPGYAAAAGDLPIVGRGESDVPPPDQPWPQQDAAEQHLARHANSLEKMHEAANLGPARYPTDFHQGVQMLLPHGQALRCGVRLLALEAHVRARQGDAHGVAEALHAMIQAGESLQREPVLVSQLVRFACTGVGVQTLEDLLPHIDFSDDDLARLQADLDAADAQDGLQRALLGERVLGFDAFQNPAVLQSQIRPSVPRFMAFTRHDGLVLYLESMEQFHDAAGKPWPQALAEADAVQQHITDRASSGVGKFRYALTALATPAMEGAFAAAARVEARNRTAATALAAERYRRQHGRFPEKLEQLTPKFLPAVPTDPFDGQPLRYAASENRRVVYSIGPDGVDDAGQETDNTGEPDITFHLKQRAEE